MPQPKPGGTLVLAERGKPSESRPVLVAALPRCEISGLVEQFQKTTFM